MGFNPMGSTPAQFAKYVTDEMAKYSKIITDAKIKME
jgi:tripartite-type tricarboxylate transporter receptor subunit TctC